MTALHTAGRAPSPHQMDGAILLNQDAVEATVQPPWLSVMEALTEIVPELSTQPTNPV